MIKYCQRLSLQAACVAKALFIWRKVVPGKGLTRLPWRAPLGERRANFSYISLQNEANCLNEKRKVGLARRATRLAGSPFCDGRVTLLTGPTFLHVNTLARPSQDNRDFKIQRRDGNENVA